MRDRVLATRERQRSRTADDRANASLPAVEIAIGAEIERLLAAAGLATGLSGRGRERVIRLARTLADLDASDVIRAEHAEEAFSLRRRTPR